MYHKIILVGNLGRDPEMRYTPSGAAVTNFSIATTEKWNGQDGPHERTIWWRIAVFGKSAEACNEYLHKGSKVLVEGRMTPDPQTGNPRVYQKSDGTSGAAYEVTALSVKFLSSGSGRDNGHAPVPAGADEGAGAAESEIPF